MKLILFFLFIFYLPLLAENPKVFASLGDELYNNLDAVEKLQRIEKYSAMSDDINKYVSELKYLKRMGLGIDSGARTNVSTYYLKKLRELEINYKNFKKTVNLDFRYSMLENNFSLFEKLVNSKLVVINKQQVLSFYDKHSSSINPSGVIQTFLDERAKKKKRKYKTKKELEKENIQRIRKNIKLKEKQREEELSTQLEEKKKKIQEELERELPKR